MKRSSSGYILFEVVIAITVFALAFTGLVRVVRESHRTSNEFAREAMLDQGLRAILALPV